MSSATSSQVLHDPYKHQREGQLPAPHSAACRAGIRLGCLVLKLSGKGTGLQTLGTGAVLCSRVLELELLGCYTCTQHSTEAQASPHRCRRVQKVPGVHRLWQRRTSKADPVRPIRVLNIRPGLPLSSLPCSALLCPALLSVLGTPARRRASLLRRCVKQTRPLHISPWRLGGANKKKQTRKPWGPNESPATPAWAAPWVVQGGRPQGVSQGGA